MPTKVTLISSAGKISYIFDSEMIALEIRKQQNTKLTNDSMKFFYSSNGKIELNSTDWGHQL
ncbi:MAG: hypothetical protein ACK5MI_06670 [Mangrovibacterium sp.]